MKDKKLRVLDIKSAAVRQPIKEAKDAEAIYLSSAATDYC